MSDQSSQSDGLSTLRSATIRLRSDIQWIAYPDTGRWVAMDPISNAFYYFSGLEHQAVLLLDGTRTVDQVFEAVRRVGLKSHLSATWIETLVQKLFRTNLIDTPPGFQTGQLATSASRGSFFKSVLANPLSVRIPLFRPSIDYAWARLIARVLFSQKTIVAMGVALLSVSYFVASKLLSRPNELLYDVGKIQGDRWLVLGAVLVAIKSIHELGHYLACVHLKVRCAEIGALFLCFTPCLYCDTTESWRLPSRWQRAGIAAAGIYMGILDRHPGWTDLPKHPKRPSSCPRRRHVGDVHVGHLGTQCQSFLSLRWLLHSFGCRQLPEPWGPKLLCSMAFFGGDPRGAQARSGRV